ncbi:hypothetical protein ACTVZO_40315 [Streptomyces sp. IBSNAI002]|uniref:hypothetical protein n=1 Tax=Streptomyces sp. IBSNAI002 TaxID=3457500 RepID=UPI003FD220C4
MLELARRPVPAARPDSTRWWRWSILHALPSAALGLATALLYQPHTVGDLVLAAAMSTTAVCVFTATMPRRRRGTKYALRQAVLTVTDADPDPDNNMPSDVYELRVFGVSVLVRLREEWNGQHLVPYVHIEHEAERPRPLLVEIDNQGESEHR